MVNSRLRSRQRGQHAGRGPLATLLLGLAAASGCQRSIELFGREGDEAAAGSGGTRDDFGYGGLGEGGAGREVVGFPPGSELVALRVTIVDKEDTGLGVQFRTLEFQTPSGPFPTRPLTADDGVVTATASFENAAATNSDPYRAFDLESGTWWALDSVPGWIQLESAASIPLPTSVFIDLHQHEYRAPRGFHVDGFDGRNWWMLLGIGNLESWAEPEDSASWEADQRTWQLLPPDEWQMR